MSETSSAELNTSVHRATVYTSQALIHRIGSTELESGVGKVALLNLPAEVSDDSVQVSGYGDAQVTILDFRILPQSQKDLPKNALRTLQEEREKMILEKQALVDRIQVIQRQQAFLESIGVHTTEAISGDFDRRPVDVAEWKTVLSFLGEEGTGLLDQQRQLEEAAKALDQAISEIDFHLAQADHEKEQIFKKAVVEFEVDSPGAFHFEVSYLSHRASWSPQYDARVDTASQSVSLRYYGTLRQNTGENWEQVQVEFSTARPHIGGNPPQLGAWELSRYVEMDFMELEEEAPMALSASMDQAGAPRAMRKKSRPAPAPQKPAQVISGEGASVVFAAQKDSDVPGNGTPTRLLVMEKEFDNEFRHLTVPKLANHVYLTTEVTNSGAIPLLPGPIRLFLDGNYVGQSAIRSLVTPGEKFELHLGVNEAIKVKHELRKRFEDEKGLLSKSRVRSFQYVITLDNQGPNPVTVLVRDQLPVSTDDAIKVKVDYLRPDENPDKVKEELAPGALEWKLQLNSRAKATIEFGFSVSHGRDEKIVGL